MAVELTYRFDRGFTLDIVMIHSNRVPSFTFYLFSYLLILPFHIGHHLCLGFQSRFCFEDFCRVVCMQFTSTVRATWLYFFLDAVQC